MEKKYFGGGRVFMATAKEAALEIPEHHTDQATWKEIMYELYVKQKLEAGFADIEAWRTILHEQVKADLLGNGH
jgi:predicted transcriptional regulator